jgi:hypothetical protein
MDENGRLFINISGAEGNSSKPDNNEKIRLEKNGTLKK